MTPIKSLKRLVLLSAFSAVGYWGCSSSDNPAKPVPDDNPPVNKTAQTMGQTSVTLFSNATSFSQIDDFMGGADEVVDLDIPDLNNRANASQLARKIKNQSLSVLSNHFDKVTLPKTAQDDSVVFDVTERDSIKGVTHRASLIYNPKTQQARFFFTGFDRRADDPLEYDSTEVKANLNGTIFDDSDDILLSVSVLRRLRPGQLIREEVGSFVPDPPAPGADPTGGVLMNQITYSNSSFISRSEATFSYHEGSGGNFEKTSEFSDGTTHREAATFNSDGTGSFEEDRRDGTMVRGTFDSPEDDGQGSYELTTTFKAGHDPSKTTESGEFTYNVSDSTISGTFTKIETKLDGSTVTDRVEVSQTRVGDILSTTLNIESAEDGMGFIAITESPEVDQLHGEWNNPDGTFVTFTAQSFSEGSSHLEAKQYASEVAFQNNEPAIATGVFDFYPDGSGRGVVTEGTDIYDVVIRADGTIEVTKRP